jgi:crotonobetainyl-CoA:carnitine CoA-transferase CaiB-like acyl-CoA transferase
MGSQGTTEPWAYLRRENSEMVCALIGEWSSQHTTAWLVAEGQRLRVPIAFPRDLPEVLESEQLATRGAWVDVELDDGAVGRAPRIPMLESAGGSTSGPRVAGSPSVPRQLRVLTWAGLGRPFAGTILADPADVVKLSHRLGSTSSAGLGVRGEHRDTNAAATTACNRGKKSVALNPKHPDARQVVLDLSALTSDRTLRRGNGRPRTFDRGVNARTPTSSSSVGLRRERSRAPNSMATTCSMPQDSVAHR